MYPVWLSYLFISWYTVIQVYSYNPTQTIRHTLQQVGLYVRRPRRKPLLKLAHKKACKQFAEDNLAKSMNYWNHVLWSDDVMSLR